MVVIIGLLIILGCAAIPWAWHATHHYDENGEPVVTDAVWYGFAEKNADNNERPPPFQP